MGDDQGDASTHYRFYDYIDENKYKVTIAYLLGSIPFRNIIEFDVDGDNYYSGIHLYCYFADQGQPYEAFVTRIKDGTRLDPELEFILSH